jgi:hypothetical protein
MRDSQKWAGAKSPTRWEVLSRLAEAAANRRRLRMARMPELRALSVEEALEVVKEAEKLAAEAQDISFYEKATSAQYVLPFAALVLLSSVLGFVLLWGVAVVERELLHLARRGFGALLMLQAVGAYYLLRGMYRRRTPQQMRPFVLKVLKRREATNAHSGTDRSRSGDVVT